MKNCLCCLWLGIVLVSVGLYGKRDLVVKKRPLPQPEVTVRFIPKRPPIGEIVLAVIASDKKLVGATGFVREYLRYRPGQKPYRDRTVKTFSWGEKRRCLFVPITFDHKVKVRTLFLQVTRQGEEPERVSKEIPWRRKKYAHRVIRIPIRKKTTVVPDEKAKKKAKKDIAKTSRIYSAPHKRKLWRGAFIYPIEPSERNRREQGRFGHTRTFISGKSKRWSMHRGYDISAKQGRPIKASNHGVVRMAQDRHYGGNTVIIDHGLGLFSVYCHLSEFRCQKGDRVKKGDIVGLVGSTGRATGPHLHWGIKQSWIYINPASVVRTTRQLVTETKSAEDHGKKSGKDKN